MTDTEKSTFSWAMCPDCQGRGKRSRRLRKKVRLDYQKALAAFESGASDQEPERPKGHLESCAACAGSGLVSVTKPLAVNSEQYPHVAIIGGGIGGVALAVACQHRGIPFTLYERDSGFGVRSQGYGLTLQQASRAIQGLGIESLEDGVVSTRHMVHTPEGKVVAEWGMRKWVQDGGERSAAKRTNIHIARQSLRKALIEQLGGDENVTWNHQLMSYETGTDGQMLLTFDHQGQQKTATADLIVGADGIRSVVRRQLIGDEKTPLRYLGCIVILGICALADLGDLQSDLLDKATVFQTANGNERIYIMPYKADSVMWQLSFRLPEQEAIALNALGADALKAEAQRRTPWHDPVTQILAATPASLVSGYPVYDRDALTALDFEQGLQVTLLGDAVHPMSPFKGQGANQALLDALSLARAITTGCWPQSGWREKGIRQSVLAEYEAEMLARSLVKVEDSAAAAEFLHSDIVLHKVDEPRGRSVNLQRKSSS
ncbi:FAD-dependent oxidoreductase [Rhodanobacter aciditrophus]|uniref:FAD-dependent oxidoreductase n=1 Tax=Rhodanobacter aciditrophus TaxID=1623218 RepID=A0ABW4AVP7_9GAMM